VIYYLPQNRCGTRRNAEVVDQPGTAGLKPGSASFSLLPLGRKQKRKKRKKRKKKKKGKQSQAGAWRSRLRDQRTFV